MIPSMDARLASLIVALEKTIIPALSKRDSLAHEQASLLMAHLKVIRTHMDHAVRFEQIELLQARSLARQILAISAAPELASEAVALLAAASEQSHLAHLPGEVRSATERVNAAIEQLVNIVGDEGHDRYSSVLMELVLAHVADKSHYDRAWYVGMGFEPDAGRFPSIEQLMHELESRSQTGEWLAASPASASRPAP
jgi:hypothetical protein